ncbi:hypothetical protein L596_016264 [Steinernema carpocapsae]|uniref:Granulins domain-containing protein n=1 Tax=Steinernema carpocapsae TaxID=34508 RepID=A0A4V6A3C8_STECR|nr:hypothetical protein L596_016264 [Steinernema carpocapsae]
MGMDPDKEVVLWTLELRWSFNLLCIHSGGLQMSLTKVTELRTKKLPIKETFEVVLKTTMKTLLALILIFTLCSVTLGQRCPLICEGPRGSICCRFDDGVCCPSGVRCCPNGAICDARDPRERCVWV